MCSADDGTEPEAFLDLRREPSEVRNATLASILRRSRPGMRLNEHLEHDCGLTVFQHDCKMGLQGSSARATVPAARRIGSSSRIRRRRSTVRKRIGAGPGDDHG
jgi:hypothetical protein